MKDKIQQSFSEHIKVAEDSADKLGDIIDQICVAVSNCIENGNKVLLFGNGGSAADAQHIAAEFTGRFVAERRSLPALALTTDSSALTSIGNDYGFDHVFVRQVQGLANQGDVLIGISTSGNSPNVVNALKSGKVLGCTTIGLSGRDGGKMNDICDYNVVVPSNTTARIQEIHILIGHIICGHLDTVFKS